MANGMMNVGTRLSGNAVKPPCTSGSGCDSRVITAVMSRMSSTPTTFHARIAIRLRSSPGTKDDENDEGPGRDDDRAPSRDHREVARDQSLA